MEETRDNWFTYAFWGVVIISSLIYNSISQLEYDVSDLESEVSFLESKVSSLEWKISNQEDEISEIKRKLGIDTLSRYLK